MKKVIIAFLFVSVCVIVSCSESASKKEITEESCENPIKDPMEPKPMALMMRTMANYCDSMRLKINAGEVVDSTTYPLMPFWGAEPTDSSVLEPLFFNNAKMFAEAYRKLMSDPQHQKANYTAVIDNCINCHSSYCSGPLKRIKKLTLDYQ